MSAELIPAVDVPASKPPGRWSIERFEVSAADARFFNLRESLALIEHGRPARPIRPGTYTRLVRKGWFDPVMSDTPAERADHEEAVRRARGRCLVSGLGIGMVVNAMLLRPRVEHVTVLEVDEEVIGLAGPHYLRKFGSARLEIVQADALRWRPPRGARYGAVWHDIWPAISSDNLPAMRALTRRYERRAEWVGCWCEDECRRAR